MNITDVERLALISLSTKDLKGARDGVAPGKYEVDLTVRVTGTLTVAPDTEVSPSASLPTQIILVQMLRRMGHSRESGMLLLSDLTASANALTPAQKKALVSESGYDEAESAYKAITTAKLGKSARRGSVSGAGLTYEVVSAVETGIVEQIAPAPRNKTTEADADAALDDLML